MMILEPTSPDIDNNELIKLLGGRRAKRLSYASCKSLERFLARMEDLVIPRIIYSRFKLVSCKDSVELEGGQRFDSPKAAKMFHGCEEVFCFLATIGSSIDEEIKGLTDTRRSSDACILDAMGSAAVENIVERFQNRIKKRMLAEGKTVTMRLSPGYCDWPLQEQQKLFSLLDTERIGVGLSESSLMQPRKTVSGMFGVMNLSNKSSRTPYNPCSDCNKANCIERRSTIHEDSELSVG